MPRQYYVYILANAHKNVLYTGVTNNLLRRLWQHRSSSSGFTARYNCFRLVFYEVFQDSYYAIAREEQIKAGSRQRKIGLIEAMNPEWQDLCDSISMPGAARRE
jgi:putative endonuclease